MTDAKRHTDFSGTKNKTKQIHMRIQYNPKGNKTTDAAEHRFLT